MDFDGENGDWPEKERPDDVIEELPTKKLSKMQRLRLNSMNLKQKLMMKKGKSSK